MENLFNKFNKMNSKVEIKTKDIQKKIIRESQNNYNILKRKIEENKNLPNEDELYKFVRKDGLEDDLESAQEFDPLIDKERIKFLKEKLDLIDDKGSYMAREFQEELDDLLVNKENFDGINMIIQEIEDTEHKFENSHNLVEKISKQNSELN